MISIKILRVFSLVIVSQCSFILKVKPHNKISLFLTQNVPLTGNHERTSFRIILLNRSAEADDILTNWLLNINLHHKNYGVEIMDKAPKIYFNFQFSDTIVFLDIIDKNIISTLQIIVKENRLRNKDPRHIIVITKVLKENSEMLRVYLKLLWSDVKLLNFLLICVDSLGNLQALNYNPFKDEIRNFKLNENYTLLDLFPDKAKNLYGYTLNVVFIHTPPFAYKENGVLKGTGINLIETCLKAINASMRFIEKKSYRNIIDEMAYGSADLTASLLFYEQLAPRRSLYPHQFVYFFALVETRANPFFRLRDIFDTSTWSCILTVLILVYGFKWLRLRLYTINNTRPASSLKMLMIAASVFNIIFTQTFQSWIITSLVYPQQIQNIHTIDDLIESKLPVYIDKWWNKFITNRLQDQFVFTEIDKDYLPFHRNGTASNGIYLLLGEDVKDFERNTSLKKLYHMVEEIIGSAFIVFHINNNSPYKYTLDKIYLEALSHGWFSRNWGEDISYHLKEDRNAKILNMDHLAAVFYLWMGGLGFSILLFIAELLWDYYCLYFRVYEFVN